MSGKASLEPADLALVEGVLARNRRGLARAITLVESKRSDHQARAAALLDALLPHTGRSIRVGITGAPGVGKSTFIEALGLHLIAQGRRVAVLAVDPSSPRSGGSILGDKTRMEQFAQAAEAFIRPTPSGGASGGVSARTREVMLVCEAAGFDVIVVESMGVGQSETSLASMVDVFVLLQMPNTGDELQAMKKGIVELADIIVITKADLDPNAAEQSRQQFAGALDILSGSPAHWRPPVLVVSAAAGLGHKTPRGPHHQPVPNTHMGIATVWDAIERYREVTTATGEFEAKRQRQATEWMWSLLDNGLRTRFRHHPKVRHHLGTISREVAAGRMSAVAAASQLLGCLD